VTQQAWIGIAYHAIRWYVGTGVFDRIAELVEEMAGNAALSGDEKRDIVLGWAKDEFTLIRTRIVDLVIALVLLRQLGRE
jgi:hypothetical protein